MGLPKRDNSRYTYSDYSGWTENIRYELVDGTAYLMVQTPSRLHQSVIGELYRQTANALKGTSCVPYIAPTDVRLPKPEQSDDATDTIVQPDLLVVCDPGKLDERGVRGAPDWIVEVLCPATASHDQIVKLAAYEQAGVREVWLVHPIDRVVSVYILDGTTYGRATIRELDGMLTVTSVPGVDIDWGQFGSA